LSKTEAIRIDDAENRLSKVASNKVKQICTKRAEPEHKKGCYIRQQDPEEIKERKKVFDHGWKQRD
jgi:hypothetical protein